MIAYISFTIWNIAIRTVLRSLCMMSHLELGQNTSALLGTIVLVDFSIDVAWFRYSGSLCDIACPAHEELILLCDRTGFQPLGYNVRPTFAVARAYDLRTCVNAGSCSPANTSP